MPGRDGDARPPPRHRGALPAEQLRGLGTGTAGQGRARGAVPGTRTLPAAPLRHRRAWPGSGVRAVPAPRCLVAAPGGSRGHRAAPAQRRGAAPGPAPPETPGARGRKGHLHHDNVLPKGIDT